MQITIPNVRRVPLAIVSCVAFALSACDRQTIVTPDPAKEQQLAEMQNKLENLSAQSSELKNQLADRDANDAETRRAQLLKEQEDIDSQRAELERERKTLLATVPDQQKPAFVRTESTYVEEEEPVYEGKPATYEVFYNKLQDDGEWIESEDYGYIFHPAVAQRDSTWRPYSDGRWVNTDRGWTWESRERFGWATYHYGRWVNLESTGWCWVPGDEWAPAWVSWRTSDRYVGWAPLPPEARVSENENITASVAISFDTGPRFYNFVETEDFGEETYVGRIVEPDRNITIVTETVNVTNITYTNNVVNNYGPDYDVIRSRSRRPVDQYQLELERNAEFSADAAVPRERGELLAFAAPVFERSRERRNDIRPVRVERKVAKVERNRGWQGVEPAQRETIKASLEKKVDTKSQEKQLERDRQRSKELKKKAKRDRKDQPANQQVTPGATPAPTVNDRSAAVPAKENENARKVSPTPSPVPTVSARPTVSPVKENDKKENDKNNKKDGSDKDRDKKRSDKAEDKKDARKVTPTPVPTPSVPATPAPAARVPEVTKEGRKEARKQEKDNDRPARQVKTPNPGAGAPVVVPPSESQPTPKPRLTPQTTPTKANVSERLEKTDRKAEKRASVPPISGEKERSAKIPGNAVREARELPAQTTVVREKTTTGNTDKENRPKKRRQTDGEPTPTPTP